MKRKLPALRFFGLPSRKSGYGNATMNFCTALSESSVSTKFILDTRRSTEEEKLFCNKLNIKRPVNI